MPRFYLGTRQGRISLPSLIGYTRARTSGKPYKGYSGNEVRLYRNEKSQVIFETAIINKISRIAKLYECTKIPNNHQKWST
ncbi:unknown protein [Microcystis aeruginosa NIES-843]|jgi:hypothetical protein|uniref:Uncharacterized protein n=1 Tax=Microcystis aeruginosa (strain NIES-843 / IAM M-2473) TaxID=449447 RepID=B0JTI7_MICAN|nr:unknown protein [Microcystis aeruginosa NIES-843]